MSRQGTQLPSLVDDSHVGSGAAAAAGRPAGGAAVAAKRKQTMMAVFAVVAILASGGIFYWQFFGGAPSAAVETRRRDLIDSKTQKVFEQFDIPPNSRFPYINPDTGDATLFPAEKCFWTRDGKAKLKPTYVLLNSYVDKPGETVCPDCGRKVVAHNPAPPRELREKAAAAGN